MKITMLKKTHYSKQLTTLVASAILTSACYANTATLHLAPDSTAIDNQYIVVFKTPDTKKSQTSFDVPMFTQSISQQLINQFNITVSYQYSHSISGALIEANATQLQQLLSHPSVAYIEQDSIVQLEPQFSIAQDNATWGLDRIDQRNLPLDTRYNPKQDGSNVTAYVIDTGVMISHDDFGGRAAHGYDFVDNDTDATDCNGHGTHVAGTIGGALYGVAKKSSIVGVRVLDCAGRGSYSGVIKGIDWVAQNAPANSVANMSLGGGFSAAVNDAVDRAVSQGVFFAVAAGNDNRDACGYSPASAPQAYTVGSTTRRDGRSYFSNWGGCVDLFAPGSDIESAWIGGNSATRTISGTSMASPHVAGVAALYLHKNPGTSPSQLRELLNTSATNGVVNDPGSASPNRLAYAEAGKPGGGDGGLREVISGAWGSYQYFTFNVPAGKSTLIVRTTGNNGDADLYVRFGSQPTRNSYDCSSLSYTSNEQCVINSPQEGTWHIMVYGWRSYTDVTLTANHN